MLMGHKCVKEYENKAKKKRMKRNFHLDQHALLNSKQVIWKRWKERRSFQILKAVGFLLMTQLSEAGNSLCKAQLSSSKGRLIVNC
jgi:hypothetical protein